MHYLNNGSQVATRPSRKPVQGAAGYFSESNDEGAPSYPGQDWFNDCIDEFLNALSSAGITYDPTKTDHFSRLISGSNFVWLSRPIGEAFPLSTNLAGVEVPPTNNSNFRYIKLTRNDPYNDSILINEIVSGTAPNASISAEIDLPDSPIHGQRVELINSSKPFLRPSENAGVLVPDAARKIIASSVLIGNNGSEGVILAADGAFYPGDIDAFSVGYAAGGAANSRATSVFFDSSRVVPTAEQNQPYAKGETYFYRVL
ncbi:hypothetical protein OPW13_19970 [Vibrio europaeus]|uniref:Uncharacterized protein n=1 Tax=Vibrio europaeus TaxID=300876 RepID=A0A178J8J3_9VIBR|nr:hypothetical protein [Vibrio europaeus]MDC5843769.1 hypothetical protein [Vibrio europaeus]MDC5860851.1 hypothetical protein [Vibrio europaeus]MDC5866284.1 hypothetical protein [Vibrio europaeus]OAM98115.1 hypothetical protein AZ468_21595 [Vibrio europaeus]